MEQVTTNILLQNSATTNSNGVTAATNGYDRAMIEVRETGGGTATVTFKGSFDGTNFYAIGFQQIDATATPARTVTALSVSANTGHVYEILDRYPQIQAVVSAIAAATIVVRLYGTPL